MSNIFVNHSPSQESVAPEAGQPLYNHAFALAFEVGGSTHEDGDDITPEMFRDALHRRIEDLMSNPDEWAEALGAPYDTYEESGLAFDYTVGYGEEGPSCPLCSGWVDQPLNIQEADTQPWLGKCRRRGHLGYYALDLDDLDEDDEDLDEE